MRATRCDAPPAGASAASLALESKNFPGAGRIVCRRSYDVRPSSYSRQCVGSERRACDVCRAWSGLTGDAV